MDAPPCVVADPVVLSARVDGVLLVIEPGKTKIGSAQIVIEQLQRAGARIIGVVLNPITRSRSSYYSKYQYYSTYYYGAATTIMPAPMFRQNHCPGNPKPEKPPIPGEEEYNSATD